MKKWLLTFLVACPLLISAQRDTLYLPIPPEHQQPDKKRVRTIAATHGAIYAGTLLFFTQSWYKDHPRTSFHTFNDLKEWQQIDKVGHAWGTYNTAKYSTEMWRWTGLTDRKSVLFGGLGSLGYFTIVEMMDAHSEGWGWSWGDMAANVSGIGLYSIQELGWEEQRIQYKFSAHRTHYGGDLEKRADALFGNSLPQRLLKDYNAQTYWWSFNLSAFSKNSKLPDWLNIAVGYGATGMFGGFENVGYDKDGLLIFDRRDIPRKRQWYLAPDIDFTKIKTNSKFMRTTFSFLNMLKMPSPALEFSGGKFKARALAF